jgi:hypothetical protein
MTMERMLSRMTFPETVLAVLVTIALVFAFLSFVCVRSAGAGERECLPSDAAVRAKHGESAWSGYSTRTGTKCYYLSERRGHREKAHSGKHRNDPPRQDPPVQTAQVKAVVVKVVAVPAVAAQASVAAPPRRSVEPQVVAYWDSAETLILPPVARLPQAPATDLTPYIDLLKQGFLVIPKMASR